MTSIFPSTTVNDKRTGTALGAWDYRGGTVTVAMTVAVDSSGSLTVTPPLTGPGAMIVLADPGITVTPATGPSPAGPVTIPANGSHRFVRQQR